MCSPNREIARPRSARVQRAVVMGCVGVAAVIVTGCGGTQQTMPPSGMAEPTLAGAATTMPAESATAGSGMAMSTPAEAPGGHAEDYTFGEPADAAASERVIEIKTIDPLNFEPTELAIKAGETVTLRVTNNSSLAHDFTLGDKALQEEHELEMVKMGGKMPDEPNAFMIEPGQTKDIVWKFTEPGELMYACHTPGHYAAGMVGKITVQ